MADEKTKGKDLEGVKKGRVKIALTSKNLASIERVVGHIINNAKKQEGVDVRGPIRMPTKKLKITVRKTPCGNGSKTWDRFTLKIYKRVINLVCLQQDVSSITNFHLDPGVTVEISLPLEQK